MSGVQLYVSSVSSSREVRSQQSEVERVLEIKQINYKLIDVSVSEEILEEMRNRTGNPTALPPQIFNDDCYCGDYWQFYDAVENEEIDHFLKLKEKEKFDCKVSTVCNENYTAEG
ncbi:SH3 domain-binding glutamic acid-rich-like protein 3 [Chiloscyllium plagiosum]|uniref:SH3 domain-binding glutamic acid-rich-like protein 3 n=1 Tax=Chiloscyllium plagiosum TaxID=36176 RepID=UPI001CB850FB|nr:SH3 domain-binding glutamic acid-rich-like protein 3 [Chiloscyllium plagiosum]